MDKNIKAQWIAALRSGEYKQTRGCLRNDKGYCCLGVLTDLAVKAGVGEWTTGIELDIYTDSNGIEHTAYLPTAVLDWAGVEKGNRWIANIAHNLMGMNDSDRRSFVEIARYIENSEDL